MSNIYEKSLALMDEYFESVSDEEFLSDILSVEKSIGPTVNEFLSDSYFFEEGYTTLSSNLDLFDLENFTSELIRPKKICSNDYEGTYSANDDYAYELAA